MTSRLIVGLGNPGKRYETTRHIVGFHVMERLAAQHKAHFSAHARVPALVAEWKTGSLRWIALKPVTFMNLSGQAVATALNLWKLDVASLLVVVDDVDVVPGGLRLRPHGSAGGHNGLKSMIEHLGSGNFARLRVGIGKPVQRSATDLADWVLKPFERSELIWLTESISKAVEAVECWAVEGPATAMNRYNTMARLRSEGPGVVSLPN